MGTTESEGHHTSTVMATSRMSTTTRSNGAGTVASYLVVAGAVLVTGAVSLTLYFGSDPAEGVDEQGNINRATEDRVSGPNQADAPLNDAAPLGRTPLRESSPEVDPGGSQNEGVTSGIGHDQAIASPDVSYYEGKYAGQAALELSEHLAQLGNEIGSLSFNHARAAAADGRGTKIDAQSFSLGADATNDSFAMIASFDGQTFRATLTRPLCQGSCRLISRTDRARGPLPARSAGKGSPPSFR